MEKLAKEFAQVLHKTDMPAIEKEEWIALSSMMTEMQVREFITLLKKQTGEMEAALQELYDQIS